MIETWYNSDKKSKKEIAVCRKEYCVMEKIKNWLKEHKKTIGWIIILIGIVVACAINLW